MSTGSVSGFAFMLAVLATPVMPSHAATAGLEAVSVDELKSFYLSCDRTASSGRLSTAEIMQCSVLYEELKRRAFGGDFGKLLAWSRAHPAVRNTQH